VVCQRFGTLGTSKSIGCHSCTCAVLHYSINILFLETGTQVVVFSFVIINRGRYLLLSQKSGGGDNDVQVIHVTQILLLYVFAS